MPEHQALTNLAPALTPRQPFFDDDDDDASILDESILDSNNLVDSYFDVSSSSTTDVEIL
jgi:hypothetical protein